MAAQDSTPKLFSPLKVGSMTLRHRVVMAPMTRFRAGDDHVHQEVSCSLLLMDKLTSKSLNQIAADYYAQRATPGGLLIAEATLVSSEAGGFE